MLASSDYYGSVMVQVPKRSLYSMFVLREDTETEEGIVGVRNA